MKKIFANLILEISLLLVVVCSVTIISISLFSDNIAIVAEKNNAEKNNNQSVNRYQNIDVSTDLNYLSIEDGLVSIEETTAVPGTQRMRPLFEE